MCFCPPERDSIYSNHPLGPILTLLCGASAKFLSFTQIWTSSWGLCSKARLVLQGSNMHSLIWEVCLAFTAISKVRFWFMLITTHSLIIINCCSVVHSSQNYFLIPLVSLEESPCHWCLGVMHIQNSSHPSMDGPEGIMDQPKHYSKIKAITKRANKATGSSTSSGAPKGASSPDAQTRADDPNEDYAWFFLIHFSSTQVTALAFSFFSLLTFKVQSCPVCLWQQLHCDSTVAAQLLMAWAYCWCSASWYCLNRQKPSTIHQYQWAQWGVCVLLASQSQHTSQTDWKKGQLITSLYIAEKRQTCSSRFYNQKLKLKSLFMAWVTAYRK